MKAKVFARNYNHNGVFSSEHSQSEFCRPYRIFIRILDQSNGVYAPLSGLSWPHSTWENYDMVKSAKTPRCVIRLMHPATIYAAAVTWLIPALSPNHQGHLLENIILNAPVHREPAMSRRQNGDKKKKLIKKSECKLWGC